MAEIVNNLVIKNFLRFLASITGGLFGTLVFLGSFIIFSKVFGSVLGADSAFSGAINPIFLVVFIIMLFLGMGIGNLASVMLVCFAHKDRYSMRSTILHQVFIYNVVLAVVALPFYVFSLFLNLGELSVVAVFHLLVSSYGSHVLLESIAVPQYTPIAVYSSGIGLLGGIILNVLFYVMFSTVNVLFFVGMPFIWGSLTLAQILLEELYRFFYKTYGMDFMRLDIKFGDDMFGTKKTEDEMLAQEVETELNAPVDKVGSDFLGSKKS